MTPIDTAQHRKREAVTRPSVSRKLERLRRGEAPRVLDLFSGCGGLSLGFQKLGCAISANVELDQDAARSHALNFHAGQDSFAVHSTPRNILELEPEELCHELGLGAMKEAIDIIIGGPPCQAYARVGRAKLRQVAANPKAFQEDARRNLYLSYLKYVSAFEPLSLVLENVPDILNQEGHNVVQEMVEYLATIGYEAKYTLLNAAHYGVPQTRDRLFLIAYRRELGVVIHFPKPSHHLDLPPGYASSRGHALKVVSAYPSKHPDFVRVQGAVGDLASAVTANDALVDLPVLQGSDITRQSQRLRDTIVPYVKGIPLSDFAIAMRNWPGFQAVGGSRDHVARRLPRDGRIFALMPEGAEYPVAYQIAVKLFERAAARRKLAPGTPEFVELRQKYVPPYDPGKFPNKWWKLRRDAPVRTLMAHLGRDCYSHIHYDCGQARTISVREAARLQSFPDGFSFAGSMNSAFRQIGNAVPPLVAACVADVVVKTLCGAVSRPNRKQAIQTLAA